MIDKVVNETVETKEKVVAPDLSLEQEDLTDLQTKVETTNLKENITDKTILKYIEGSYMETELTKLETSGEIKDFTVEKFATEINTTVETYLKQSFKVGETEELAVSDDVLSSLSIGIQFSMMEALTKSGAQGADFFSKFSETDTKDASSTFSGLTSAFGSEGIFSKVLGGVGKTNEFFTLAKKVDNCVGFVSRYCGEGKELGDGSKVQKLANANDFRKLLASTDWNDDTLLLSKTPTDMGLTVSDSIISEMSDEDKADLKKIVDNNKMPINKKTIEAILASLPTAQSFLEKRSGYKDQAVDLMTTVTGLLDTSVFGFGTLGSIIGIQNPMELFTDKDGKKKGGVLNFALKIMGFSNGMESLYQAATRQSIDKNLTTNGKSFITNSLKTYKDDVAAGTYDGLDTVDTLGLTALDVTLQAKIPPELTYMQTALYNNVIKEDSIFKSPEVLTSLGIPYTTDEKDSEGNDIVKYNKADITEEMITQYLKTTIPTLTANTDFMTGIKTPEDFVLALSGGLVCGTCYAAGVALDIENVAMYPDTTTKETPTNDSNETLGNTPKDLGDTGLVNCALTSVEYKTFAEKVVTIAKDLGIEPTHLMKVMSFESGGTLSSAIQNPKSKATGLIQFLNSTALTLSTTTDKLKAMTPLEQLDIVKTYFEKQIATYGKLSTLEDVYLAVFSPAFIRKPLNYVAYYKGDAAYTQNKGFDTNKDDKMTVEEITETVRTSTKDLTFFETTTTTTETLASTVKIDAKTMDDVVLVGDSHAGGIDTMGGFKGKTFFYNGYDAKMLLAEIKKKKTSIQKYKSLVLVTGANDISKGLTSTLKDNLTAIQKEISPVQLVLSTLPYSNITTTISDPKVDEVNTIIKTFAKDNSLPIIDIHKDVTLEKTEYTDTGHYTTDGYTKIATDITTHITGAENTTNLA